MNMKRVLFLVVSVSMSFWTVGQECDSVPELNREIVALAKSETGKKVDRGECWDLANFVLTESQAEWDGLYGFGRVIDPTKECVFPGDVIQFERVRLKYTRNGFTIIESMDHHTAIVASVTTNSAIRLIHQNTGEHGKKVGESDFNFNDVVRGKIVVYRPVPQIN